MKTIIHIGSHKTGTKSIQHFLKDNRIHLMSKGLYVPVGLLGYEHPSHFMLNLYALDENRMSHMKEQFKDKSASFYKALERDLKKDIQAHYKEANEKGCDAIIWSNEGLYLLNSAKEYRKLLSLFRQYSSEIECVCCFRGVESYRKSYIKELQKHRISQSNNPDSYRYTARDSWLFDYARKKALLGSLFDSLVTFDYNANDNLSGFFNEIGYSPENIHNQNRLNESSA